MNYLIRKHHHDSRLITCGIVIPDGFFVVTQMSFDNQRQLENIRNFGYIVESTELPEGHYTPDGLRVDKYSILDFFVEKTGPLRYIDKVPQEGAATITRPTNKISPPDVRLRPPSPSISDIKPAEASSDAPAGVLAAMERNRMPAPETATEQATEPAVSNESELEMLRSALDSRGIDWHPRMKAETLRAKLENAAA